jgi:hypothetical protein
MNITFNIEARGDKSNGTGIIGYFYFFLLGIIGQTAKVPA